MVLEGVWSSSVSVLLSQNTVADVTLLWCCRNVLPRQSRTSKQITDSQEFSVVAFFLSARQTLTRGVHQVSAAVWGSGFDPIANVSVLTSTQPQC